MRRTGQGGSILGFIIAAVVLTGLLGGGVYLVHLQSASSTPAVVQPPEKQPSQPTPTSPQEEDKKEPSVPQTQQTPSQLPSSTTGSQSHQLPQTGPKETLLTTFGLALVSGILVSYVRSRRQLASL